MALPYNWEGSLLVGEMFMVAFSSLACGDGLTTLCG
jgi:hypothetical protein